LKPFFNNKKNDRAYSFVAYLRGIETLIMLWRNKDFWGMFVAYLRGIETKKEWMKKEIEEWVCSLPTRD